VLIDERTIIATIEPQRLGKQISAARDIFPRYIDAARHNNEGSLEAFLNDEFKTRRLYARQPAVENSYDLYRA
jgi:hypothetical protein